MIVVQHLLPPIRAAISKKLVEEHGLKKSKVSQLMGLTPAAVTQYLNKKRGDDLELINQSPRINELISDLAEDLASDSSKPDMLLLQMCRICQVARS
jgi:predicted transcriptional regulator